MPLSRSLLNADPDYRPAFPKVKDGKECAMCGGSLRKQKPSSLARRRYCSRGCAYAHRRVSNPRRHKVCVVCRKPVGFSPKRFNARGITCSEKCGYLQRKLKTRKPRKCEHCHKEYFTPLINGSGVRKRFCSQACRRAEMGKRPAFLTANCKQCGKEFRRTTAALKRRKNSFCGLACAAEFNSGENNSQFRGGSDPNRGSRWLTLAESIRKAHGYACKRCGITQAENGEKLSVDHVRPWRSFEDKSQANDPANLVPLCRSCHAFKTSNVERAWLRGDVQAFQAWVRSLSLPSVVGTIQ